MSPKTVAEIASAYLNYFQNQGHTLVPSSSLIPAGDPTLLFTTAGMVQFKPLFTGAVELPYRRAASVQKCIRTTDLEVVGKTERHCTFFEMLGNFSFGDYFKKEAIHFALDFSLHGLEIPLEKIWVTVYLDDDEAVALWKAEGIPSERIVRLGKKDNFWGPAGESGACGPCTELYLDRGVAKGFPGCGTKSSCAPGCDCDRFLEYWNLVFNQFNQTVAGELQPLEQTGIDTGSGLERVAMLLQGADSVYDTDELQKILSSIEKLSGVAYSQQTKQAFRVITDHSRSIFFAIGDSIYPDRTGRGYVVRRLLRRAALFARKLGIQKPFLFELVPVLTEIYSKRYPELKHQSQQIQKIIHSEEELFLHTLEVGLEELEKRIQACKEAGKTQFSGQDSFLLYGTYGFPMEMTKELVQEAGLDFSEQEFQEALEKNRTLSRSSWKGSKKSFLTGKSHTELKTQFLGYEQTQAKTSVIFSFDEEGRERALSSGEEGVLVLASTPFYAEGGGQVGDIGYLKLGENLFQVTDTQKENDSYLHLGKVLRGSFQAGMEVLAEIEVERRQGLRLHHSSTHLLHGALRRELGNHVTQKGSIVEEDYLRFDFSHPAPLTPEEIQKIEAQVNLAISSKIPVDTQVLPLEEAKQSGALSMFDEKYGKEVRVVGMGEHSKEFCGGTHVQNTGEIQQFAILKESSPGAGTRRIEAVAGKAVVLRLVQDFQTLAMRVQEHNLKVKDLKLSSDLLITQKVPDPEDLRRSFSDPSPNLVQASKDLKSKLIAELETRSKEVYRLSKAKEKAEFQNNPGLLEEILGNQVAVGEYKVVAREFQDVSGDQLKALGDSLKSRDPSLICILLSRTGEDSTLVIMSHKKPTESGFHAGNVLKTTLEALGGRGGGRPDMSQGGGKFRETSQEIFALALSAIKKQLGV